MGFGFSAMSTGERIDTLETQVDSLQQETSELEQAQQEAILRTDTPAADLRVGLNGLLKEHVDLGLITLRNAYDGDPAFDGSFAQLDQNSQEIAATVGSVYGDQAETQFLELWRAHIGYFADYTTALKQGDQQGMDEARANLRGYGEAAGEFFSNANPNLPKNAVQSLAEEHADLVIASMNAYHAGNYEEAYQKEREANKQVSKIANALAAAIVKQNPEVFS